MPIASGEGMAQIPFCPSLGADRNFLIRARAPHIVRDFDLLEPMRVQALPPRRFRALEQPDNLSVERDPYRIVALEPQRFEAISKRIENLRLLVVNVEKMILPERLAHARALEPIGPGGLAQNQAIFLHARRS